MKKAPQKILCLLILSLLLTVCSPIANATSNEVKLEIPGTETGYITISNIVEQKQVEGVKYFFTANSPAKITFVGNNLVFERIISGTWDDPNAEEVKFDVKKYKIVGDETVYDDNYGAEEDYDKRLYLSGNSVTLKKPGTYTIFAGSSMNAYYHYVLQVLENGYGLSIEAITTHTRSLGSAVEGEAEYALEPQLKDQTTQGSSIYASRLAFHDGLAFYDFQFIDRSGNVKFSYPSRSISGYPSFEGGSLIFRENGQSGVINSNGKVVVNPGDYDSIVRFSTELLKVKKRSKYGLIDRNGKEVLPVEYKQIDDLRYYGLATINKDNLYGAIDSNGQFVVKLQNSYDAVRSKMTETQSKYDKAKREDSGMHLEEKDGKFSLSDSTGKNVTLDYENVEYFANNTYLVRQNKKYGLVDSKTGKELVKPKYDKIHVVDDRTFSVVLDGKLGFVDTTGKEFAKPQYDYNGDPYFEQYLSGDKDLIRVQKNGKFGLIDHSGKEVIRPQFDLINNFSEGLAAVLMNGKWGFIYNPLDIPSDWAKAEVEDAFAQNLVPDAVQYGFTNNITRADFSNLVVKLLEVKSNKTAEMLLSEKGKTIITDAFNDTSRSLQK